MGSLFRHGLIFHGLHSDCRQDKLLKIWADLEQIATENFIVGCCSIDPPPPQHYIQNLQSPITGKWQISIHFKMTAILNF